MAEKTKNTKKSKKISPSEKEERYSYDEDLSILNKIKKDLETSKNNTLTWSENHDKFYRLRMRQKKTKNFPFPGCANLRLPTIEIYIRKTKAALVGLYNNMKPRMQIIPQSDANLLKASKIERFLDWVADHKMRLLKDIILLADKMLEKGFSIAKVTWEMRDRSYVETLSLDDLSIEEVEWLYDSSTTDDMIIEVLIKRLKVDMSETVLADNMDSLRKAVFDIRQGKKQIQVTLRDELYNAPKVIPVDPAYIHVPTDAVSDIQKLRFITHEYYESYEDLIGKVRTNDYSKSALDEIDYLAQKGIREDKSVEQTKDLREGIIRKNNPSHLIKIYEHYTYYTPPESNVPEKWMFIVAPDFNKILKKQRLPFDHQKWPFVRFQTEIIDDRWFSPRGYPEHLEDISKEIDAQHNQKIDNQTIRNAPMFKFRSGIINPNLVKFIPGQGIPVPGMTPLKDAIEVMNNNNPNVEFSYEREELLLKTVLQEYLGQVDYSVQSMINKREPRTLGEVQMQAQAAGQVFSLDASLFTDSLTEIFIFMLELCQQYMPERIFALVTGGEDVVPLNMTRDEIQGKYQVVARANDINSNPNVKLQKAYDRVELLINPMLMRMGIVTPINVYNILKRYMQDTGEVGWKDLISIPTPQPPNSPDVKIPFDELAEGEQAQILMKHGIKPDFFGRHLEKQMEITNEENKNKAKKT